MSAVLTPPVAFAGRRFRFTREQYYRLGELGFFDGRRVERIRGEIVEMSPKNWPHVVASRKTAGVLERAFTGIGWVSRQDPISLPDSDPEPDVAVLTGRMEDYSDHPTTAVLVVEVADTTLFDDTTTMAEMYAEAGIADYWVLDLNGRRLLVFRDPQPLPTGLGATAYRIQLALGPADRVSPLGAPNALILVSDLLP
jgi:Uma2 family endonuclease